MSVETVRPEIVNMVCGRYLLLPTRKPSERLTVKKSASGTRMVLR